MTTNTDSINSTVSRRKILAAAAAVASLAIVKPSAVHGAEANSKIRLGLIGCGGRGSWIADLFRAHGGYEIVSAADYFDNRVNAFGDKFNIDPSRRFTTLSCYKQLLETDVDAVAIESPPYFHPEQAAAAVDAGKHVYCAKPIAVDVPGVRSVEASGKKASEKNLAFLVDFQTRANDFYIEAVKRVHNGALGGLTFGDAKYHANRLGVQGKNDNSPEARLRNWVFDIKLSGDILIEQNIHSLDVMSWLMNQPPLHAIGSCGRKSRVDVGDCSDHFSLLYQYPQQVGFNFSSKQYNDGGNNAGIVCDLYGSAGRIQTKYGGQVVIYGKNFYKGGKTGSIYKQGAVTNIANFHKQITEKQFENPTVAPSVQSHLTALLGRTAAYETRQIQWNEIIKSTRKMKPDLKGLKS